MSNIIRNAAGRFAGRRPSTGRTAGGRTGGGGVAGRSSTSGRGGVGRGGGGGIGGKIRGFLNRR